MNDPRRLLEGDASALERALLQAADTDEPSSGAEQRLLLSLGLLNLPPVSPSTAPAAKAALGKSLVAVSGKWLLLAGIGVGVGAWWSALPPEPAPVATTHGVPHDQPELVAPADEPTETVASASSLAREVAALDRARAALVSGDEGAALAVLTEYQRAHPTGVLQQEATVLRIDALWAAHDEARARRAATAFLRAHPQSPHAARLQALLKGRSPALAR